jgi:hypothetical protein
MVGTTYTVPPMAPDPASTDYFDVAPLRIGVEYRKVDPAALQETYGGDSDQMAEIDEHSPEGGFTDEGVSVHVISLADEHEYLRFDVFIDEPHYHYVDRHAGTNTVVPFDTVAHGEMLAWTIGSLRDRLPEMLSAAGAADIADAVTPQVAGEVGDRVEAHLRSIGEL